MKAKSINGKTSEEFKAAMEKSMIDGFQPTLAFVFLTQQDAIEQISAILDANGIAIFGASTSEKFTEEGIDPDGIVALLLDANPDHFKIVLRDFKSASVYESACQVGEIGNIAFSKPAFIISASDNNIPGEEVINGILDKAGATVMIVGGMAGEPVNFSGTVFTNNSASTSGLLSLIVDQNKIDVKGIAISGWKPFGTERKITKCEGAWIYTIDNEPAMNVIKKYLGKEIVVSDKSEGLVPLNINFPLQVQREAGNPMMRPALLWNTEDQSVMVGGPVKEGSRFRFSLPPDFEVIDEVIESSRKIKEYGLPDADAMLIFSCVGRLSSLGPMLPLELEGLTATWNKPMAGFFSMGEFGKLDETRPEFHGTTVSWVALKEK